MDMGNIHMYTHDHNYTFRAIRANLTMVYFRISLKRGQMFSDRFQEGANTNSRGSNPT